MKGNEFEYEPENEALLNFLLGLKNNKDINFCAYFNYHSAGGIIYYKPYEKSHELVNETVMPHIEIETLYNKKIANLYGNLAKYKVMKNVTPTLTCFNDLLRLKIPGDILIELSDNTANPVGPYEIPNYNKTINNNIEALAVTLEKLPEMNKIKQEFIAKQEYKNTEKRLKENSDGLEL